MRLNKLNDPGFDYKAIKSKYSFYRFNCNGHRQRANICDQLKAFAPVLAIRNSGRGEPYHIDVMALSDEGIDDKIRKVGTTEESSEGEVSFAKVQPEDLPVSVLLQLMMSSITKNEMANGPSNASGNFYIIVDEKTNVKKGIVTEIIAFIVKATLGLRVEAEAEQAENQTSEHAAGQ